MYVDANTYIHAELDTGPRGQNARRLLSSATNGTVTSTLAIQEVLHILRKHKRTGHENTMAEILNITTIEIVPFTENHLLCAAKHMDVHNLDSADAVHLAIMEQLGETEILSDDTDFDSIPGITRIPLE